MDSLHSSYNKQALSYGNLFSTLAWQLKPKKIVEFGILEGYSLRAFVSAVPRTTEIYAHDIFENFVGNAAKRDIYTQFADAPNVFISEGDFYKKHTDYQDGSIDIIHIDIANDGAVYEFAFEKYLSKLVKGGVLLLEGGSAERDDVYWMKKYGKVPIVETLKKYASLDYVVLTPFPSLTIVRKA